MSNELRNSTFCEKTASVVEGKIFYSCRENLIGQNKDVLQFYSCDLWNLGLEDSCNSCKLECINNKNDNLKDTLEERRKLESVIDKLRPNMMLYGVSADQVEGISSKYTEKNADGKKNEAGREAIQAANFANETLKAMMSGKVIDVAFFSLYARKASGRIRRLKKKRKNRSN